MASRGSSNGSTDGQNSTASSPGIPRMSLDEGLRALQRSEPDFSDMPSLSSFRADEMSAMTSTSYTSYASNSRAGDSSRGGDCDASLPSLSSFRIEDLSTCSSFHSTQTATNNYSDQSGDHSGDGWASFTSGNNSGETLSDDEESGVVSKTNPQREVSGGQKRPTREKRSRVSSNGGDKRNRNSEGKNLSLRSVRSSPEEPPVNNVGMKRPTRTVSPGPDEKEGGMQHDVGVSNARPPTRRSDSPQRAQVERSESLPLTVLQQPNKDRSGSSSSQSLREITGDGSSSSLRGGDSLPRLPRRTSIVKDSSSLAEDDDSEASRLSDDASRISDDDDTRISEDSISLNSDVASDISIDTVVEDGSVRGGKVRQIITVGNLSDHKAQENLQGNPLTQSSEFQNQRRNDTGERTETKDVRHAKSNILKTDDKDVGVGKKPQGKKRSNFDGSGVTSAEESGTSVTDTEAEESADSEKEKKREEKKRPMLLKRVSSSLRNLGKSTGNSFRMIGKTASKLKQMGSRKDDKSSQGNKVSKLKQMSARAKDNAEEKGSSDSALRKTET